MKITRGKTGSRRSHHGLTAPRLSHDKETDSTHKRHHVDLATGMYRGKQVFEPKVKTPKVEEVAEEVVEKVEDVKEKAEEVGEEIKESVEEVIEKVTEEKKEEK